MEPQEEIIDLGPLIQSPRVAFQFDTPGWYVLLTVAVIILLFIVIIGIRKYLKNAYRREALRLLEAIENRFQKEQDVACLNDAMILLKQVSLQTYSRSEVADLHGEKWLNFLDSKSKQATFSTFKQTIFSALYKSEITDNSQVLGIFKQSQNWIENHA